MKTLSHAFDRGPRPAMADSAAGLLPLLQKGAVACAILAVEPELLRQGLTAPIEAELAQNGVALTPAELASGRTPQEHAADLMQLVEPGETHAIILVGDQTAFPCAQALLKQKRRTDPAIYLIPAIPMGDDLPGTAFMTLCTALEAHLSPRAGRTARDLTAEAAALIVRNLSLCCVNPADPQTHQALQRAVTCCRKAGADVMPGYTQGMAEALMARYGLTRLQALAAALPVVLDGYGDHALKRLAQLAHAAGLASEGAGREVAAASMLLWLRETITLLGLEPGVKALRRADVPELAHTIDSLCNPRCAVPSRMDRFALEALLLRLMDAEETVTDAALLVERQHQYFRSGATLPLRVRADALTRLRTAILARERAIHEALHADLGKCPEEAYLCETGMVLSELSHMQKHLHAYAKARTVSTPLHQFAARSRIYRRPYGVALIMSPWNYPFLLTMGPLIGAIAAGNCCVVKPSAYAPATSAIIREIITACFPQEYAAVIEGGRAENQALLDQPFDKIFFTGGEAVGREVLRHAAERLTPVTLELGGKSPVVVTDSAKIDLAARRIAFGKLLNAGQTCVAPDYVLVHRSVRSEFINRLRYHLAHMAMENPLANDQYVHIVNRRHYERVMGLIDPAKVVYGGAGDPESLRIQPTILDGVTADDPVMQEEIFGPVLPLIEYETPEEAIAFICDRPTPLAFYLFTGDKAEKERFLREVPFGGGCVNDTIIHLASTKLPFGGLGRSGMGCYHGRYSFECFSHEAGVVDKATWLDLPMRYAPYDKRMMKLIRFFLK